MSAPILITIPSYMNTSRSATASLMDSVTEENITAESPARGKKRRLDHLTWEEKILRKKLKNRVAAQTSRDRKKAKMDQMESSVQLLTDQNQQLIDECQKLREFNEKLLKENTELHNRIASLATSCRHQACSVGCGPVNSGSAVSSTLTPLQKGRAAQPAALHLLLQILMACLLLPTSVDSTPSSTLKNLKNLHKVYSKTSLENLKQIIKERLNRGDIQQMSVVKKMNLPNWWGRHQKTWNPVDVMA